ncbi:GNAT family N-acetyltransferase [Hymenobacter pini]|uniref:GNAT family N-acetyltransferase n=1 Tax=Hymenobacter pini TaxID=2880879 RepID=UPI001CF259B0|nr:GNAT family N-acetyltransferase [Hymenobacter pini]MCA8830826.1 GNAT family N-acetyltransferase [Hymenobacter pini]
MNVDLDVLERWLIGWSMSRGLPLPQPYQGGLMVKVGWPEQVRRYVFTDAGQALKACAAGIREPFVHLKATVEPAQLRRALSAVWQLESPRYLMSCSGAMAGPNCLLTGYRAQLTAELGATVLSVLDETGQTAATGRIVLHQGTAVFDRVKTLEAHRRKGLATYLMRGLDALAVEAGVKERLLVATEDGRALYLSLGWQVVAPYSTAISLR